MIIFINASGYFVLKFWLYVRYADDKKTWVRQPVFSYLSGYNREKMGRKWIYQDYSKNEIRFKKYIYMELFIDVLSLILGLGWDEEFGSKLEEIENKAQVPQGLDTGLLIFFFSICKFISPFLTQQEYWFSCWSSPFIHPICLLSTSVQFLL